MKHIRSIFENFSRNDIEDYVLPFTDDGYHFLMDPAAGKFYNLNNFTITLRSPIIRINKKRGIVSNAKIIKSEVDKCESEIRLLTKRLANKGCFRISSSINLMTRKGSSEILRIVTRKHSHDQDVTQTVTKRDMMGIETQLDLIKFEENQDMIISNNIECWIKN
jgi:hypothetical protein